MNANTDIHKYSLVIQVHSSALSVCARSVVQKKGNMGHHTHKSNGVVYCVCGEDVFIACMDMDCRVRHMHGIPWTSALLLVTSSKLFRGSLCVCVCVCNSSNHYDRNGEDAFMQ